MMNTRRESWYVYQRFKGCFEIINDDDDLIAELLMDQNKNALGDAYLIAAVLELLAANIRLVERIDEWMDFGERPCQLCDHHYNHDKDCPYVDAKHAIAKARGDNETAD